MDCARKDLVHLLSDGWCAASNDYYVTNTNHRAGVFISQTTGETELHRVTGQRIGADAIRSFLEHYTQHAASKEPEYHSLPPLPRGYLTQQTYKEGATALHVAITRNSWEVHEIVSVLIEACPALAIVPMHCRTYPLHMVTGMIHEIHDMHKDDETASDLFRTVLDAAPTAAAQQDCNGDTPLSLLYKNVLQFPWAKDWDTTKSYDENKDASISPIEFLEYSLQLLEAVVASDDKSSDEGNTWTWHTLCSMTQCPPLLVQMLLHQYEQCDLFCMLPMSGTFQELDDAGRLPLHCAASAQAISTNYLPEQVATNDLKTVVELVLAADPAAAGQMDSFGRFPLHYAVDNPSLLPFQAVLSLARAFPTALTVQDPWTGLYPTQKLAATMEECEDCNKLDLLFQLLHMDPSVCAYHT